MRAFRACADVGGIRSGLAFSDGNGADRIGADERGQEALLLLLGPMLDDGHAGQ